MRGFPSTSRARVLTHPVCVRRLATSSVFVSSGRHYNNIQVDERSPSILHIALNRPPVNAFNAEMIDEITHAFTHHTQSSSSYRAVLLSATGKSFSGGADLAYMKSMAQYSRQQNEDDANALFGMVNAIYKCPLVVLGQLHGAVFGGAVGIVSAMDVAFADSATTFSLSEVRLGLAPAAISKFVMERIGVTAMRRYALTAERFDAAAALHIQLINGVYNGAAELNAAVDALCNEISSNAPNALRETKALLRRAQSYSSPEESRDDVCKLISTLRASPEGQEGIAAFFEKRKPAWNIQQTSAQKSNSR